LLTQDQITIAVRLVYIAQSLDQLGSLAARGTLSIDQIVSLLGLETGRMEQDIQKVAGTIETGQQSADPVLTGKFWHFVLKATERTFAPRKPNDQQTATFLHWLNGLGDAEALAQGEQIHNYIDQLGETLRPKLAPYQHVLRNHLAALFLVCGFPWRPKAGNYIAPFFRAVVSFAATQLYIRLYFSAMKNITTSEIAEAIFNVEHSLGHHERIYHALARNPAMLHVGQYAASFASLG